MDESEYIGTLEPLEAAVTDAARVVRPGDILVISCPEPVTAQMAARIREAIMRNIPVRDVVVLDRLRFEFVYRTEDTEEAPFR